MNSDQESKYADISLIYGDKAAEEMQAFDEGIQAIEDKHRVFFNKTTSKYATEDATQTAPIGEYFLLEYSKHNGIRIEVEPTLPFDIAEEINDCFKRSFGS